MGRDAGEARDHQLARHGRDVHAERVRGSGTVRRLKISYGYSGALDAFNSFLAFLCQNRFSKINVFLEILYRVLNVKNVALDML